MPGAIPSRHTVAHTPSGRAVGAGRRTTVDAVILVPVACLLVAALFILRSRMAVSPWNERLRLAGVALLGIGVALMALRIAFLITS